MTVPTIARPSILVGLCLCVLWTGAQAERFEIRADGSTSIVFESHAPLESFEGKTQAAVGFIEFDPGTMTDTLTVEVEVDLMTLDTGISKRNTHMHENHLHTAEFPKAVFRGATLGGQVPRELTTGTKMEITVHGSFSLHGVTRRIETPLTMTLLDDDKGRRLSVSCSFDVYLADYEIPRPKFLFVKLDEKQQVTFETTAPSIGEPKP